VGLLLRALGSRLLLTRLLTRLLTWLTRLLGGWLALGRLLLSLNSGVGSAGTAVLRIVGSCTKSRLVM
jgi:hypothetical protein